MNSELIYTTFFSTYLLSCLIGITKHGCNKSLDSCSPHFCSSASLTRLSKCNHNLQSTRQSRQYSNSDPYLFPHHIWQIIQLVLALLCKHIQHTSFVSSICVTNDFVQITISYYYYCWTAIQLVSLLLLILQLHDPFSNYNGAKVSLWR